MRGESECYIYIYREEAGGTQYISNCAAPRN